MSATQAALPALPSLHKTEMDERKRPLANDLDELVPSRKRLKDDNGNTMRMSDEQKEREVEDFQKDAILRQMKEYKRQKKDVDDQLAELHKKTRYHNDHLRTIDAWFAQLLDEVRVLTTNSLPTPPNDASPATGGEIYTSALLFEDNDAFSTHLALRSTSIKTTISDLFGRFPSSSPDVSDLRKQISNLSAREKEHAIELKKTIDDKDLLYERLEQAMGRYMTAERKLDRAKSTQVQKLERQAIMGGNGDSSSANASKGSSSVKKEHSEANGDLPNGVASAEVETARKEAVVAAEKQKAQLEEIEVENHRLTNELSAARTKIASLSDDDYAETSLFKTFRAQFEDAVKRLNDLEAANTHLREEALKLQSERTTYRTHVDEENRSQTNDIEAANARAETDLARIRHARDQLSSDLAIFKSAEKNNRSSTELATELAEAKEMRIAALESQVQRMELQLGENESGDSPEIEEITVDALKAKFRTLSAQYSLLGKELPSMEAAWKKAQALASKKIDEISSWEEQIARLSAEKTKADQKYFAAMKAKDMRESELRALKSQNARSTEIVSQLKEGEAKTKELCGNYERQLAESKDGLAKLEQQTRALEQTLKDATNNADSLKKTAEEMKALVTTKDKDKLSALKAKRDAEEDLEKCKVRLEESKKMYDTLRKSRVAASSTDSDDWRKVAICPVCNANIRNTVLKLCGHVFCSSCVKDLISNRSRKCPSCGRGFGTNDQMGIVLT